MYHTFTFFYLSRNRPSFRIVYTTPGTLLAASYTATCSKCKCTIHHSSWTQKFDQKEELVHITPATYKSSLKLFEIKVLDQVTRTIQVAFSSGAMFESQAQMYNATNGTINETRQSVFVQAS